MIRGYIRVSTQDQKTDLQKRALTEAGATVFYRDSASGAKNNRPGLTKALAALEPGDTLIVWKLDRLGRNLGDLITTIRQIEAKGAALKSLTDDIDTTTPAGRLFFHMAGAFAEFERNLIVERTRAGCRAAKARGVKLGRKPSLTPAQIKAAARMREKGVLMRDIANAFNVNESTLYRNLPPIQP